VSRARKPKAARLPPAFAALEAHIDEWVLPDSPTRAAKRERTPYADIKRFYDAMLPHAPSALEYLAERQLGQLNATDACLLKLMLALAEVGPAVEWYQHPSVIDGFAAERFALVQHIPDTAAQE
jgi:hypothetical protein